MPPGSRQRELFLKALEKSDLKEREAFLNAACGDDTVLRDAVNELLGHHQEDSFLQQSPAGSAFTMDAEDPTELSRDESIGDRIGRYKLLQRIGEGGCGVVYMAEQEEPVRRRVALKVIKLGMDTRSVIARFEAERQALAMMDHPNIARVFDAGATGAGRPYFVMELVRGVKITDFCDQHHLATRDRLELFIKVCQAIQHAHQKGIIHRDIKPSNILVTLHDGVAVPKVIDFGIAKATSDQRLTDKTLFTALEQFIGTPAYMSPEQAEMSGLDIDTRSDIYSLGVLLYEMLTGKTPFDTRELLSLGLDAMRRKIREQEPARPSTRLSTMLEAELATTAKNRQSQAVNLIHLLRGDVDWIVMKCLEKDRARRYETANGLATDIQRHLNNEAVLARPPSATYRFQKLIRRNKLAVFTGAAVAAALAFGLVLSLWQAIRARRAEQEARRQLYVSDMVVAEKALREGNLRRADELLRAHSPKTPNTDGADDARGFEYHYLREQCNGDQEFILSTNENAVFAVAYSPDGKLLATGSSYLPYPALRDYAGELKLFNAETGRLVAHLPTESPDGIRSVVFSRDGKRIAAGCAGSVVTVWDIVTHQRLDSFFGRTAEVGTVALSPDGRLVAATFCGTTPGIHGTIVIWNTGTRQEIKEFAVEINRPEAMAFSPDGKWLAYIDLFADEQKGLKLPVLGPGKPADAAQRDNYSLQLWDIQEGREGKRFELPLEGVVHCLQFSPDSQTIALGATKGLVATFDFQHSPIRLGEHAGDVFSVQFSVDGRLLATGSADSTIKLWDLTSSRNIGTLRGHRDQVKQVAFSPDATRLVSASFDKTVRVWSTAARNDKSEKVESLLRAEGEVTALQFHPQGKFVAIASAHNIRIVDLLRNEVQHSVTNLTNAIWSLAFSPDGLHLLAGDSSLSVSVWETETWRRLDDLTTYSPEGGVYSLCFSRDGRFAFAGGQGFVTVWETGSWNLATNLLSPGEARLQATAVVSPNSRLLAVAGGPFVQLYEVGGWGSYRRFEHPDYVGPMVFGPNQTLITGCRDSQVRLWDVKDDAEPVAVLGGSVGEIATLALSPDGNTLASSDSSPVIKLWNPATKKELFALAGNQAAVSSLVFSPDGRTLASGGGDATVRLWGGTAEKDLKYRPRR